MEELKISLSQYSEQLSLVSEALASAKDDNERQPLLELKGELQQLIQLTKESLDATVSKETEANQQNSKTELDDEYALFMKEMAQTGAYDFNDQPECSSSNDPPESKEDIEDELASLLGMKCAVYHTHRWGGEPSLHNAMVSSVEPRQDNDQFQDLQVRVLFTHPTHAEMLPCPFYLNGECKFDDTQCRYSHGNIFPLSDLKDAIAPDFESIKVGSRILLKLKAPEDDDISLTKKSSEKYHLWHRAIVKNLDVDEKSCIVRLEHGINTGGKRKAGAEDLQVKFEDIFPLNVEGDSSSDSEDSLSDTEYPDCKNGRSEAEHRQALLVEKSLLTNAPSMGDWERHTRGIGSKLMLAMGYVPGTGLGATGDGRLAPVEARQCPVGKSLDHCMEISERHAGQDPLKVEQKLKRLQKKEEERNKRAYEREKERERRNVFNFLNRTLGDKSDDVEATPVVDIKATTSRHLNIEQFKITEDSRKIEKEISRLNSSLERHAPGTTGHRTINSQIAERNKELNALRQKEQQIVNEQRHRKDKQKMTVF